MKTALILLCALLAFPVMAQDNGQLKEKNMKTLIVYFSYTAGNTKRIAERIQASVGGDIVRLEPVTPYEGSYDDVVRQGQEEVERGYKPALKPLGVNVKDKMAPVVLTFLSGNDFTGKTVIPFMTNAGWPGTVIKDMNDLAKKKGAKVGNGHEFRFSSDERHFDRMETPEKELDTWIESLK